MRRPRTAGMFVGLLALPVALLGALPASGWRLTDVLPIGEHDSPWVRYGGQEFHRGSKVRVTGGALGQLSPGTSAPVALTFHNRNSHPVRMKRVRVRITAVVAPQADAAHPCTTADFVVRQMPKGLFRIPARRTTTMAALGVPSTAWPSLMMVNRPLNQDGCKGATLSLKFKARGLKK